MSTVKVPSLNFVCKREWPQFPTRKVAEVFGVSGGEQGKDHQKNEASQHRTCEKVLLQKVSIHKFNFFPKIKEPENKFCID